MTSQTKLTYVCRDGRGNTRVDPLFVFRVESHRRYSVTSNPTELGIVRQDNKVVQPRMVTVSAFAYRNGPSEYNDWEEYFTSFEVFSVIDNGIVYNDLTLVSIKTRHDSEVPDLIAIDIEFEELLNAESFSVDTES